MAPVIEHGVTHTVVQMIDTHCDIFEFALENSLSEEALDSLQVGNLSI